MPSCSTRGVVTVDVDEFRAFIRPVRNQVTFTAAGHFAADGRTVNLHRLQMQGMQETLPRILDGEPNPKRHAISFYMEPGPPIMSRKVPKSVTVISHCTTVVRLFATGCPARHAGARYHCRWRTGRRSGYGCWAGSDAIGGPGRHDPSGARDRKSSATARRCDPFRRTCSGTRSPMPRPHAGWNSS